MEIFEFIQPHPTRLRLFATQTDRAMADQQPLSPEPERRKRGRPRKNLEAPQRQDEGAESREPAKPKVNIRTKVAAPLPYYVAPVPDTNNSVPNDDNERLLEVEAMATAYNGKKAEAEPMPAPAPIPTTVPASHPPIITAMWTKEHLPVTIPVFGVNLAVAISLSRLLANNVGVHCLNPDLDFNALDLGFCYVIWFFRGLCTIFFAWFATLIMMQMRENARRSSWRTVLLSPLAELAGIFATLITITIVGYLIASV